jgi:ATP-dependent Clp protease ATP-binding subunit ClpB
VFQQLSENDLLSIVDIQVEMIAKRLEERRITLTVTPAARAELAHRGYDPVYGARPLKRLVQRELLDSLALKVLNGELPEGTEVAVDQREGELVMEAAAASKAVAA